MGRDRAYFRVALGIGIAALVMMLMAGGAGAAVEIGTIESNWTSKPVIVNLQIDLEDEQDVQYIYPILAEIQRKNWVTTVYVTGEIAEKHPDVIRSISEAGHYIGIHGWKKGENLSELSSDEQLKLINKSILLVRSIVYNNHRVVDYKSQSLDYDNNTIQTLQDQKIRTMTGVFSSNESFCKCWFAKSIGKITFPYPITNDFFAVPISTVEMNSKEILLKDEVLFNNSAITNGDYLVYLIKAYEEHNKSKDPLVIEVHPSITNFEGGKLGVLSQFLDYVSANNGVVKPTALFTNMGSPYIDTLTVSGSASASTGDQITLKIDYTSTLYCPTYYFRAYGKYPNGDWKFLNETSYYVMTGSHTFNMQVRVPEPSMGDTLTIRIVGQACVGGLKCWPDINNFERSYEITVNINAGGKDLSLSSSDISIRQRSAFESTLLPMYIMSAVIHNKGNSQINNVEVRFIDKSTNRQYDTTISGINAGSTATVSATNWDIDLSHDFTVQVDPSKNIQESNENNNEAETHKIYGTVTETSVTPGLPLKNLKIEYQENDGTNWVTKWATFTDDNGKYSIITNLNSVTQGRNGRVKATLMFSPDKKDSNIKIELFDEGEWGDNNKPRANAQVRSKISEINPNPMDNSRDYKMDFIFTPEDGGSVYEGITSTYLYFMGSTTKFEPNTKIPVEYNDDDGETSYTNNEVIHVNFVNLLIQPGKSDKFAASHEYSHIVADPWGLPYGPGGPGDGKPEDGLDENWANFGASLARNDPSPHGSGNWNYNMDTDVVVLGKEEENAEERENWPWSMADTWWDLDKSAISKPNNVVETLRIDRPQTVKSFYEKYKDRDTLLYDEYIKSRFKLHGYDATWWPPYFSDPDFYTGIYKDYTVDTNGDGYGDFLNIDIGLNISNSSNYTITGILKDNNKVRYCSASNQTYIEQGISNVTLSFPGSCIFEKRLNGTYYLNTSLFDANYTSIDYRNDVNTTGSYSYNEFRRPSAYLTGTYTDSGNDTNGDGLYNYLLLNTTVNVTQPGTYIVKGSLFDNAGNYIADTNSIVNLTNGTYTVPLNFEGMSIYASRSNGTYLVKGVSIFESNEKLIYYDYTSYSTAEYNFTQFQTPTARILAITDEVANDTDSDGFYNYLNVSVNANIDVEGLYAVEGIISNSTGYGIATTNNYSFMTSGVHSLILLYDGKMIRNSMLNGPYNISIKLDRNDTLIGKTVYTTLFYNYTQFQPSASEYFNITYSDHGNDINGGTLYDNLTVNLSISTIIPANYSIQGYLYDKNGSFVSYTNNTANLTTDTQTVLLNFDGKDIWRSKKFNESYNLTLKLYDNNYTHTVELKDVYATSAYNYSQFQRPKGAFDLSFSEFGNDSDGNGFYDYLTVDVGLDIAEPGNFSIYGTLVDNNGSNIVSASNSTYLITGNQILQLNFDGMQIFEHGVNGSYNLSSIYLSDANGSLIDFRANAYTTSSYNFTQFEKSSIITGWVSDNNGAPVSNASVIASGTSRGSDITGASGSYRISALKTGSYFIRALPPDSSNLVGSSNTIDVIAGNVYTVNITLNEGARISGVITDINGSFVPNATVQLSGATYASVDTDKNGSYNISGLSAGYYHVYIYPKPTDNLMNIITYTTLVPNQNLQLNFTLQPAGSIAGLVIDANGIPIPDALVFYSGYETPRFRTDDNGWYIIPRLSAGIYTVNIETPDRGFVDYSSSVSVVLGQTSLLNFSLQNGGVIRGNVTDSNGVGVPNANVYVSSGPTYKSTYTDANGNYSLGGLLSGNYIVYAQSPSGSDFVSNFSAASVSPAETVVANIVLYRGGVISGNVTDSNGTAIANAYVYVSSGPTYKYTYSDANGNYSLGGLLSGNYIVYAQPPSPSGSEFVGNSSMATVSGEQKVIVNIVLSKAGVITGKVTYSNGTNVANAYVYVYSGPTYKYTYSDANGNYSLGGLLAGNYTLFAQPPSGSEFAGNFINIRISAEEIVKANIVLPKGGIFKLSGSARELWNTSIKEGIYSAHSHARDYDIDSAPDIIAYSQDNKRMYLISGRNGAKVWERIVGDGTGWLWDWGVNDLDGDGGNDLVVIQNNKNLTVLKGKTGDVLWNKSINEDNWDISIHDFGDISGDGKNDILLSYNIGGDYSTYNLSAIRGFDGFELWNRSYSSPGVWVYPQIAGDLNKDGKRDLLVLISSSTLQLIEALDGSSGSLIWSKSGYNSIPADDLNADGYPDAVISSTIGTAAVRGYDAEQLWNASGRLITLIGDINGDNKQDVIETENILGEKHLSALSGSDGSQLWSTNLGVQPDWDWGERVKDLNGDGKEDIIVGVESPWQSNSYRNITVFALSGSNGNIMWSRVFKDLLEGNVWMHHIGDLTGDGRNDIALNVRYKSNYENINYYQNILALTGYDGLQLWDIDEIPENQEFPIRFLGDFNGDGKGDVVQIGNYFNSDQTVDSNIFYARAFSGNDINSNIWRANSSNSISLVWSESGGIDYNVDGYYDIALIVNNTIYMLVKEPVTSTTSPNVQVRGLSGGDGGGGGRGGGGGVNMNEPPDNIAVVEAGEISKVKAGTRVGYAFWEKKTDITAISFDAKKNMPDGIPIRVQELKNTSRLINGTIPEGKIYKNIGTSFY